MTRLQFRIAAILISAVSLVVAISTLVVIVAITYPDPERMVAPVASQIRSLSSFVSSGTGIFTHLSDEDIADLGPERPDLSEAITSRLQADGIDLVVKVYDDPAGLSQVAVVQIDGNTIAVDFPGRMEPPLELWLVLGTWMALVVLGVVVVSLFMAYRVTQPFAILERSVTAVGPDGVLPHVPEEGSGESRATAAVLNRLSERLRNAMESRMRLVAAAGHDFRTPMTRMRLRAEFLADEDRAAWLKDIDELDQIADSAIRLVQEEVNFSQPEPVSLDELVADEVRDLARQGYDLELGRVEASSAALPPLAIKRAVRNLLINAATHGRGGVAEILNRGSHAAILIADQGPGIPDELLARVFEPFFRAEPGRIKTIPGAGLGLAIAAEIIERVGGALTIRNAAEGGLIQEVSIPLVRH